MALKISHYILRYICTNGAISGIYGDNKSLIHYNLNKDIAYEYIKESVKIIEKTRDNVIDKLKVLNKTGADKKIRESALRRLSGVLGFKEAQKLMNIYEESTENNLDGFDSTEYSLFNFITSSAKEYDIYKRTNLEQVAGDLFLQRN